MADREEPIIMVIMAEAVSFKDSGGDKFMELNRIVVCILQLGWLEYGSQLVCALTTYTGFESHHHFYPPPPSYHQCRAARQQ